MSQDGRRGAPSLDELAHREVLDDLHAACKNAADAVFTLAGELPAAAAPVRLAVDDAARAPGAPRAALSFPADPDGAAFQSLLAACRPASSGRGGEAALDPADRRALALPAAELLTDFALSEHGSILAEVHRMMMPTAAAVHARLDKLNVLLPGGSFKRHVDTPRSADAFGTLVVRTLISENRENDDQPTT